MFYPKLVPIYKLRIDNTSHYVDEEKDLYRMHDWITNQSLLVVEDSEYHIETDKSLDKGGNFIVKSCKKIAKSEHVRDRIDILNTFAYLDRENDFWGRGLTEETKDIYIWREMKDWRWLYLRVDPRTGKQDPVSYAVKEKNEQQMIRNFSIELDRELRRKVFQIPKLCLANSSIEL